jgi:NAD(P)-dependent dehydrogenase (short-subunit alcohol dehydrogenase family)
VLSRSDREKGKSQVNRIDMRGRWVLVTGASTGIGRAISESLASCGVRVVACARRQTDISALSAIPYITGLRMDVTCTAEIEEVAEWLADHGTRLFAIINNAGIAVGGPMLTLPESELDACLRVNTIWVVIVLAKLGLSDLVYRHFLRDVKEVSPSYFMDQK